MSALRQIPFATVLACLLFLFSAALLLSGGRMAIRAIRAIDGEPRPEQLMDGGRRLVMGMGFAIFAAGLLAHDTGMLDLGQIFMLR